MASHSSQDQALKKADGGRSTDMAQSPGTKQIKVELLANGQASDIGKAPPSRNYTRDYSKVAPEKDDVDLVTGALGNPLRF
jgi:hypothetical protein